MLAAAIRAVDAKGVAFTMDESLGLTGGAVPSGQALNIHAMSSNGVLKDGNARLTYHVASGRSGVDYAVIGPLERNLMSVNDRFFSRYELVGEVGGYRLYKITQP